MNGHDVLQETAALIRHGRCCNADARDRHGKAVLAYDTSATAWSLTGALALVSEMPGASLGALGDALWGISGVIPDESLDGWNNADGRRRADTLQMLQHASNSLRRQPPPVSHTTPSLN